MAQNCNRFYCWGHALRRRTPHGGRRPPGRRGRARAHPAPARDLARHRRRRLLRDPAAEHPPPARGRRPGQRSQGRALVEGHAGDDGRRRARLRPPALRHGGLARTSRCRRSRYCYPRVEVEVAFVLGETLPGEGCTEDDVIRATEYVAPAIELIDSRVLDWNIEIADTIADNASSAGYVLGPERVRPEDVDLTGHRGRAGAQRREGRRGSLRRGARQPGHGGRLAGRQGRLVRGHPRGGPRHPARVRCTARSTCARVTTSSPTSRTSAPST